MVSRSEPFLEFLSRVAVWFRLPETSHRLLEELIDPDADAEAVAAIIEGNQYVARAFLDEVATLGRREVAPSIQGAISLYGISRARNFVCALQLVRVVGGRYPDAKTAPAGLLKFALRAEAAAASHKPAGEDLAFAAGFLFDVMSAVGRERFAAPAGFEDFVASVFEQGLKTAAAGRELLKPKHAGGYSRYAFAACLAHDIGRPAFELLNGPGSAAPYRAFRDAVTRLAPSPFVARFAESARYGLGPERFGAELVARFPGLARLEKAVLFQHEPYFLKATESDLWQFASQL